jgi:hypothetical protein
MSFYQSNKPIEDAIVALASSSRSQGRWMIWLTVLLVVETTILVVLTVSLLAE